MIATANNSQLYLARETAFGSGVAVGTPVRLATAAASWQVSYTESARGSLNRFGSTKKRTLKFVTGSIFKEFRLSPTDAELLSGLLHEDDGYYSQRMLTRAPSFVLYVEMADGMYQKASGLVIDSITYSSRPKEVLTTEVRFKAAVLALSEERQLPGGVFDDEIGQPLSHTNCTLVAGVGDRYYTDYNCTISEKKSFRFERDEAVSFAASNLSITVSYSEYISDLSVTTAQIETTEQTVNWSVSDGEKTLTVNVSGYPAVGNEPIKTEGDAVRQVDTEATQLIEVSLVPVD